MTTFQVRVKLYLIMNYERIWQKRFWEELINQTIVNHLGNDIDFKKTDKILKIIVQAAVFELLYKHNNSIKVIIVEYLKAAEFFLEKSKVKYLNAILDKISRILRKSL